MDWNHVHIPREDNLPLYLQLAATIRNLIAEKKLLPLEQIPVSRELQKRFFLDRVVNS